jgi:hypothetical protein
MLLSQATLYPLNTPMMHHHQLNMAVGGVVAPVEPETKKRVTRVKADPA